MVAGGFAPHGIVGRMVSEWFTDRHERHVAARPVHPVRLPLPVIEPLRIRPCVGVRFGELVRVWRWVFG